MHPLQAPFDELTRPACDVSAPEAALGRGYNACRVATLPVRPGFSSFTRQPAYTPSPIPTLPTAVSFAAAQRSRRDLAVSDSWTPPTLSWTVRVLSPPTRQAAPVQKERWSDEGGGGGVAARAPTCCCASDRLYAQPRWPRRYSARARSVGLPAGLRSPPRRHHYYCPDRGGGLMTRTRRRCHWCGQPQGRRSWQTRQGRPMARRG